MRTQKLSKTLKNLVPIALATVLLSVSPAFSADYYPPRVSVIEGTAAYEANGQVDWDEVTLNLPLLGGDRIFSQPGSRVEIELGDSNFIRLGSETDLFFHEIQPGQTMLQLFQGELIVRLNRSNRFEVLTPNGKVTFKKEGLYRISSAPTGEARVLVRKGRAEVEYASGKAKLKEGQELAYGGNQLAQVAYGNQVDSLDNWSDRRDAYYVSSRSVSYVGGSYYPGVYDLDRYGMWYHHPLYGSVWSPFVSVGWAPFRLGRWGYLSLGWTWLSYEPWGWLPYHYGSWTYWDAYNRWCWVPGGFNSWSPALVNFYFGPGYVGWAPWGYYGGHGRHGGGGGNNTVVVNNNNNTVINNWNSRDRDNALTVVRRDDFGRGRNNVNDFQNPSRDVVNNLRSGLPPDLENPSARTRSNQSVSNTQNGIDGRGNRIAGTSGSGTVTNEATANRMGFTARTDETRGAGGRNAVSPSGSETGAGDRLSVRSRDNSVSPAGSTPSETPVGPTGPRTRSPAPAASTAQPSARTFSAPTEVRGRIATEPFRSEPSRSTDSVNNVPRARSLSPQNPQSTVTVPGAPRNYSGSTPERPGISRSTPSSRTFSSPTPSSRSRSAPSVSRPSTSSRPTPSVRPSSPRPAPAIRSAPRTSAPSVRRPSSSGSSQSRPRPRRP